MKREVFAHRAACRALPSELPRRAFACRRDPVRDVPRRHHHCRAAKGNATEVRQDAGHHSDGSAPALPLDGILAALRDEADPDLMEMLGVRDIFDRKEQCYLPAAELMATPRQGADQLAYRTVRVLLRESQDAAERWILRLPVPHRASRLQQMLVRSAERWQASHRRRDARADERPLRQKRVQRRVARQDEVRELRPALRLERLRALLLLVKMPPEQPDEGKFLILRRQPWRLCPLRRRLPAPRGPRNACARAPLVNSQSSLSASSFRPRRFPGDTRSGLWP